MYGTLVAQVLLEHTKSLAVSQTDKMVTQLDEVAQMKMQVDETRRNSTMAHKKFCASNMNPKDLAVITEDEFIQRGQKAFAWRRQQAEQTCALVSELNHLQRNTTIEFLQKVNEQVLAQQG